jgi:hypothetical protein
MDFNKQKEQFSIAYTRVVVAAAGYNIYKMDQDEDSIDLGIAATGDLSCPRRPHLNVQLKCTGGGIPRGINLPFNLKMKNYNDLRVDSLVPSVLVVVVVPNAVRHWIRPTESQITIRRSAYWISLNGRPPIPNTAQVSIHIPRSQQFTPAALKQIMQRIDNGGAP